MTVVGKMWVGDYQQGYDYMVAKYGPIEAVHCNQAEADKVFNPIPNKTLKVGQYIFKIKEIV